jgi:hypothetical protein
VSQFGRSFILSINNPRIPSPSQQCKRRHAAGAPLYESLFILTVLHALRSRLMGARDLIIDSAPILAWRRRDPDAADLARSRSPSSFSLARLPSVYPHLSWFRLASLLSPLSCQLTRCSFCPTAVGMGCVPLSDPSPRCPFGCSLLGLASHCLDSWRAGSRGRHSLESWTRNANRSCLPPTWTADELGKRSGIERFFGRVFLFFHLQRPPLSGWSEIASQVALTYSASLIVGLAAQQAHRPDLIRSPKRVLAHLWEKASEL